MSVAGFFLLLLILIFLPFVPGILEIRRKQDAQPLQVVRRYDVKILHFANRFGEYIETHFARDLSEVGTQEIKEGGLEDGSRYSLLGANAEVQFDEDEGKSQVTNKMFIAAQDLTLPGAMTYLNELYAGGAIQGADEDIYRALLAGTNIELGRDSMLLRWMHAATEIRAASGSVLYGRVSAGERIVIASGSQFHRLNAKEILFGEHVPQIPAVPTGEDIKPEELPVSVEVAAERWLIESDLSLPDHSIINADLVVVGILRLGKHCEIHGAIKCHKVLHIEEGCAIHGAVVSTRDIHIASNVKIKGPLVSEARINISANCEIGRISSPTTITAETIHIQADVLTHGTVWARAGGSVDG